MQSLRKVLISFFIIFNFLTMIRIFVPLDKKFFGLIYKPVDAYLSFFSIYQDWMMFAPDPARVNSYIGAEVEFEDGTKEKYAFPGAGKLNIIEKYFHGEKFRKITSEGIRKNENSFMWQDTAKFVLRKMRNKNFEKIPLKVHLIRYWDDIPPMTKEFRPHRSEVEKYQEARFYTYEVI